jgi:hypothetical protein
VLKNPTVRRTLPICAIGALCFFFSPSVASAELAVTNALETGTTATVQDVRHRYVVRDGRRYRLNHRNNRRFYDDYSYRRRPSLNLRLPGLNLDFGQPRRNRYYYDNYYGGYGRRNGGFYNDF